MTATIRGSYSGVSSPRVDIDLDYSDAQDVAPYARDIFDSLFVKEKKYRPNPEYFKLQPDVNGARRATLVSWMGEVAGQFKLLPESYQLAVSVLDRFLSLFIVPLDKLQLAGLASLLVAAKMEENYPPEVGDFVYISAKSVTRKEMLDYEQAILNGLGYQINVPVPIDFQRRFSKAAGFTYPQHTISKYLIELSLQDEDVLNLLPSQLAAGATYLAKLVSMTDGEDQLWSNDLVYYTHYSEAQARSYAEAIQKMVGRGMSRSFGKTDSGNPVINPVVKKYSSSGTSQKNYMIELPPVTNLSFYVPPPAKLDKDRRVLPRPYPNKEPQGSTTISLVSQLPPMTGSVSQLSTQLGSLSTNQYPSKLKQIEPMPVYPPSEWD